MINQEKMKIRLTVFSIPFLIIFLFSGCSQTKYDLAIIAGTVIDGNGGTPSTNKLLLISNGKIERIADAADKNKYTIDSLIDAHDKYVIPGLFDMHGHITMNNRTIDTSNGGFKLNVVYDQESAEWGLRALLYYGVMNVRETADFLKQGMALKKSIDNGSLVGPEIFTCGPLIEFQPSFNTMSVHVHTVKEAITEVQREAKAGVQFVKVYVSVPPLILKAVIDEAHKHNLKVLGHLGVTNWTQAANLGIDGLVHTGPLCDLAFTNLDSDSAKKTVQLLAKKKIYNDPTLAVIKNTINPKYGDSIVKSWPFVIPAATQKSWDQQNPINAIALSGEMDLEKDFKWNLDYVTMAYKAGVPLLIGTDFNNPNTIPGYSLHQELQLFSQCGIPNNVILKIATHDAAEYLGILKETGTIESNKNADLIILDKNPLEDIRNTMSINKLLQHGKLVEREKLLTRK